METQTKVAATTTVGGRIQEARRAKGLSIRELARRVGVSHVALGNWEKDMVTDLKGRYLEKLSKEVGKSARYILTGKERSKVELSDEAIEIAHAWEEIPEEWKERVHFFVVQFGQMVKVQAWESKLGNNRAKGKRSRR